MYLDFTTTSCLRPEIILKTYKSFRNNLKDIDFDKSTLYINIDRLPITGDPLEIVKIAKNFFGKVVYNITETPNFSSALKWCWENTTNDYVFHIEDDWELLKKFNVKEVLSLFSKNNIKKNNIKSGIRVKKEIVGVTPRAYNFSDQRLSLTPTLFDGEFVRKVCKDLILNKNPEKRLLKIYNMEYGQYHFPKEDLKFRFVKDIGREWLNENEYNKNKKTDWTRWNKI